MQKTQVWSLIWEDPTCHKATKPRYHNSSARALESVSCNYQAHVLQLLKPARPRACALQQKSLQWEACTPQLESSPQTQKLEKSPAKPKINKLYIKKKEWVSSTLRVQVSQCVVAKAPSTSLTFLFAGTFTLFHSNHILSFFSFFFPLSGNGGLVRVTQS